MDHHSSSRIWSSSALNLMPVSYFFLVAIASAIVCGLYALILPTIISSVAVVVGAGALALLIRTLIRHGWYQHQHPGGGADDGNGGTEPPNPEDQGPGGDDPGIDWERFSRDFHDYSRQSEKSVSRQLVKH